MTRDSLEQELLDDGKFQHILKFAPQSQRELMTFELANYFYKYIEEKVLDARVGCFEDFLTIASDYRAAGNSLGYEKTLQAELSKLKEEE